MIYFRCDHCGKSLKAPDGAAGKRVDCPRCEKRTKIPFVSMEYTEGQTPGSSSGLMSTPDIAIDTWSTGELEPTTVSRSGFLIISVTVVVGLGLAAVLMLAFTRPTRELPGKEATTPRSRTSSSVHDETDERESARGTKAAQPKASTLPKLVLPQEMPTDPSKPHPADKDGDVRTESPKESNSPPVEASELPGSGCERKEPLAAADKSDLAILKRVNAMRGLAGLADVAFDGELSSGCAAQAKELAAISSGASQSAQDAKGHRADGRRLIIHSRGYPSMRWPSAAVDCWMATLFHRVPLLDPFVKHVGIGQAFNRKANAWVVVLDVGDPSVPDEAIVAPKAVVFPPDRQRDVPLFFSFGMLDHPNPIPSDGNPHSAGYPITVTFWGATAVTDVAAFLNQETSRAVGAFTATEAPFWLSTPQAPAVSVEQQQNTICLIPKAPLAAGVIYSVTVSAGVNGQRWRQSWRFSTAAQ